MKWIKRGVWAVACGLWALLGVGLYRELPRTGALVAELAFKDEHERWGPQERPLGFTNGDGLLVTQRWQPNPDGGQTRCTVWEVAARRRRHDLDWPLFWTREIVAPGQGVVIGNCRGEGANRDALTLFDLRTAEQRRLGPSDWRVEAIHPERPWAAIDVRPADDGPEKVLVIDFRTGERLFEWTDPQPSAETTYAQDCQFLGGDEFLITTFRYFTPPSTRSHWDVHQFSLARGELARMSLDRNLRSGIHLPMRGGRLVLISLPGDGLQIDVVEFPSGRTVFASAALPAGDGSHPNEWRSIPTLSPSGRRLMSGAGRLWDLDAARPVWWKRPGSDVSVERDASTESFSVYESWQPLLDLVGIPEGQAPITTAVRDFETGAVRYRTWGGDPMVRVSADGRLGTNADGQVFALPPPANWVGVILAEAVLALPLVLVWLVLRWQRKRRLRLASVSP